MQDAPRVALHAVESGQQLTSAADASRHNYVIAMTDPDAPSRDEPKWSEFCHWVASAGRRPKPSTDHDDDRLRVDEEVVEYRPPGPPAGTGRHRYVFVALVPSGGGDGGGDRPRLSRPPERKRWGYGAGGGVRGTKGLREWARENGLVPVGEYCVLMTISEVDESIWLVGSWLRFCSAVLIMRIQEPTSFTPKGTEMPVAGALLKQNGSRLARVDVASTARLLLFSCLNKLHHT